MQTLDQANARIAKLTDEVIQLRELVYGAYHEGFSDGFYEDSASNDPITVGKAWETSFAKVDLDDITSAGDT